MTIGDLSIGLSPVLRMASPGLLLHWCEACAKGHQVNIHDENANGHRIGWNGHVLRPSFIEPIRHVDGDTVCEYSLIDGVISYSYACTHRLAGEIRHLLEYPLP